MTSVTASQLRSFNALRRPERDASGRRNHYHFAVKALPGGTGEKLGLTSHVTVTIDTNQSIERNFETIATDLHIQKWRVKIKN